MPTPAPAAPRPPPTPRAILPPASEAVSAWAMISERMERSTVTPWWGFGSVVLGDGAAEVDGRERREDEGLQGGHQADLEDEEDHAEREGQPADRRDAQQHRDAARHEEDDQVAGEDVGEE